MSMLLSDCTREQASEITERFRDSAGRVETAWHVMVATAIEAYKARVWIPLGYNSWNAYCAEEVNESAARIPTELRIQMVGQMSEEGMSTRAIGPVVGASQRTVANDVSKIAHLDDDAEQGVSNDTPEQAPDPIPASAREWSPETGFNANPFTGEVIDAPTTVTETHSIKTVTGLDGKTYTKPEPKEPRRTSIIDTARNAGWELRKAVERLERIHQDDRFSKNKVEIMAALQPHLDFANEVFSDL